MLRVIIYVLFPALYYPTATLSRPANSEIVDNSHPSHRSALYTNNYQPRPKLNPPPNFSRAYIQTSVFIPQSSTIPSPQTALIPQSPLPWKIHRETKTVHSKRANIQCTQCPHYYHSPKGDRPRGKHVSYRKPARLDMDLWLTMARVPARGDLL